MKQRTPDYFPEFQCIGSECKDNCCIGWEIDIDPKTYAYYQSVPGDFGDRLRRGIKNKGTPSFQMRKGRCVFLDQENLCTIHKTLGEDKLCQICRDHPRFLGIYGDITEIGLGIACEVAARLILENPKKMGFIEDSKNSEENSDYSDITFLFQIRKHIFAILQNRDMNIWSRMKQMLVYGEKMQKKYFQTSMISADDFERMNSRSYLNDWISFYTELDCMDKQWIAYLHSTIEYNKSRQEQNLCLSDLFYEQLSVYFIYRYFMKASFDQNLLGKIKFAVISCLLIYNIAEAVQKKPLDIARIYSKEIEYSEGNLYEIFDEILFD